MSLLYLRLAGLAAVLIALALLAKHLEDIGAERVQAKWDAAVISERIYAANQAVEQARKNAEAADKYAQAIKSANARANAAQSDLGSLRHQLAAVSAAASAPGDACRPERERIGVLARLLAEGADLASEGAERVERLDAQLSALQGL